MYFELYTEENMLINDVCVWGGGGGEGECYTDSAENVHHNDKKVKHVWVCNLWMMCYNRLFQKTLTTTDCFKEHWLQQTVSKNTDYNRLFQRTLATTYCFKEHWLQQTVSKNTDYNRLFQRTLATTDCFKEHWLQHTISKKDIQVKCD